MRSREGSGSGGIDRRVRLPRRVDLPVQLHRRVHVAGLRSLGHARHDVAVVFEIAGAAVLELHDRHQRDDVLLQRAGDDDVVLEAAVDVDQPAERRHRAFRLDGDDVGDVGDQPLQHRGGDVGGVQPPEVPQRGQVKTRCRSFF
jgi:hypothetical protein